MNLLRSCVLGLAVITTAGLSVQCKGDKKENQEQSVAQKDSVTIEKSEYGTTAQGEKIESYKLKNQKGMEVDIMTYGGRITSLKVPNKAGVSEDVVLGFNNFEQYTKDNPFFGALIGRYGNRIGKAKFSLDGVEYKLTANDGPNSLHGGPMGFDKVIWTAEEAKGGADGVLKLKYVSKDMEEGFPGNLTVFVTYTLKADNTLEVDYEATTDKKNSGELDSTFLFQSFR